MCALPEPCWAEPIRTAAPTSKEHTMSCPNPQCVDGLVPNPYAEDPEDVTLCPDENPGYDPRDHYGYDAIEA